MTLRQLRSFLGFCNFYRQLISHFSDIAKPLTLLTKKAFTEQPFTWTSDQQIAFEQLKKVFTCEPVLKIPDPKEPFYLETNALAVASGGQLM